MKILGLVKTSTVDCPQKLVCVIFLGVCNLNCEYCHNRALINPTSSMKELKKEDVLQFLEKRKGILEGVCISGGEPSLQGEELIKFVDEIKYKMGKGFVVKLDTNGTKPEFLNKYIEKFDYIAMDFKTLHYEELLKIKKEKVFESLEIIKNSKVPYEIRITMYPDYIGREDFEEIAKVLKGVKKVFIQQYKKVEGTEVKIYSENILEKLKKKLEDNGIESEIR